MNKFILALGILALGGCRFALKEGICQIGELTSEIRIKE